MLEYSEFSAFKTTCFEEIDSRVFTVTSSPILAITMDPTLTGLFLLTPIRSFS